MRLKSVFRHVAMFMLKEERKRMMMKMSRSGVVCYYSVIELLHFLKNNLTLQFFIAADRSSVVSLILQIDKLNAES